MANIFGALRHEKQSIDIPAVVVIGLGRFGSSLARELMDHGVEVLGIDNSEKFVRDYSPVLTEVVQADTTDAEVLRQLGIDEVDRVVLAIGSHLEDSILTASNLVELGVKDIWAKADSDAHARILQQLGVHHVIRPERDTGRRIAHLLGGKFEDFAEIAADYGVTKLTPPAHLVQTPLDPQKTWEKHRVQLVSVRKDYGHWMPVEKGQQLNPTDLIVIAGSPIALEKFSEAGS